jgi:two-component system sensor histidine kinase YesM
MFRESPSFVPLSREIHNVETYVQLQRMMNSLIFDFSADIDKDLMDFSIPPLTILTFVENSVKHGVCQEKPLIIHVKAKHLENGNKKYVNITILDNGRGFTDEELRRLNSEQAVEDLKHVGISNVKRRFLYQYKGEGIISFSSSNGASVEIFIPIFH